MSFEGLLMKLDAYGCYCVGGFFTCWASL